MPLVRRDSEGVFVIVGGRIARPPTPETTHPAARGFPVVETTFSVGDRPRAHHRGLAADVGGELWFIAEHAGGHPYRRTDARPNQPTTPATGATTPADPACPATGPRLRIRPGARPPGNPARPTATHVPSVPLLRDTATHDEDGVIKAGASLSGSAYLPVQLRDTDDPHGRVLLVRKPDRCNHGITMCPDCAQSWELDYLVHYQLTSGGRWLHAALDAQHPPASPADPVTRPPEL